jgi:hypothetical protein
MSTKSLHARRERLSARTLNLHFAILSLMEELDAIDWYRQRADDPSCLRKERQLAVARALGGRTITGPKLSAVLRSARLGALDDKFLESRSISLAGCDLGRNRKDCSRDRP